MRDFRGDHWKLETQLETTSYIILQHMHVPVDYTLENYTKKLLKLKCTEENKSHWKKKLGGHDPLWILRQKTNQKKSALTDTKF